MKQLIRFLGVALLGVSALALASPMAHAGRFGGPASALAAVPAYDSVYFDIPFTAGEPAVVSISNTGGTQLDLYLVDSNGTLAMGIGAGIRKTAAMYVTRPGWFRAVVRNAGPVQRTFVISTN
jgi:hypothetical protein